MAITAKQFKQAVDENLQQGLAKTDPREALNYWWCLAGIRDLVTAPDGDSLYRYVTNAMVQLDEYADALRKKAA